jgi:hypothetical protein
VGFFVSSCLRGEIRGFLKGYSALEGYSDVLRT